MAVAPRTAAELHASLSYLDYDDWNFVFDCQAAAGFPVEDAEVSPVDGSE